MNYLKPIPLEQNLRLLEIVGQNPHTTQADLAAHLGVAVGTVNWYLRRMIARGYIKVRRMERKRLLYSLTPRGLTEKSRLGLRYVRTSLEIYRTTRRHMIELLTLIRAEGYSSILLQGEGDLVEICRLTCLDQQIRVAQPPCTKSLPTVKVDSTHIVFWMPGQNDTGASSARYPLLTLK